jgi:Dolichyl-phosphate-mannose-protein mannosyltransferase
VYVSSGHGRISWLFFKAVWLGPPCRRPVFIAPKHAHPVSQRNFEPLSGKRSRIDWGITILLLVVFMIGTFWFTRGNRYPFFYDTEEAIRGMREIGGTWDFHRPLLSAVTTKALKNVLHVPDSVQSVVELGRMVSAFFAVGSIICLCLTAYFLGNATAAGFLALLLLCQHQLFAVAHTMSENSSLLFGASLVLLAIVLLEQRTTVARSLFLGVSVALAVSAKYIGILLIIPALVAVLRSCQSELRVNRVVEFVLGFLFVILVVNFYAVTALPLTTVDVLDDLGFALAHAPEGFKNLVHGNYWLILWRNTTPAIWIMIAASIWLFCVRWRRIRLSEVLLGLIPLVYFLVLLFGPYGDLRFLPVVGFTYTFAIVGVASLAEQIARTREEVRGWLIPILFAICLAACFLEFLRGYPYYAAFNWDQRLEMLNWMDGNIPPGSHVFADPSVLLPQLLGQSKQKHEFALVSEKRLNMKEDRPKLDQLADSGVDYVVVCPVDYQDLLAATATSATSDDEPFNASKEFYRELFKRGTLLWERDPGPVQKLQPGLEIYRLPKNPG